MIVRTDVPASHTICDAATACDGVTAIRSHPASTASCFAAPTRFSPASTLVVASTAVPSRIASFPSSSTSHARPESEYASCGVDKRNTPSGHPSMPTGS